MTGGAGPGDGRRYLDYQYSDAEKYLARVETHRAFSEAPGLFHEWAIAQLDPPAGTRLLDVGCGPGIYHEALLARGLDVVGTDLYAGMLRTARASAGVRALAHASAERLPFAKNAFDALMANHMLYHVEDRPAALREMRRVLRPGGRVLLTTNAADNMRLLHDLHTEACRAAGLQSTSDTAPQAFTLSHIELVQSVFPTAELRVREDALVFRETAPLLRYYASYIIDYVGPMPLDGGHRPLLLGAMRDIAERIIARNGVLRIPKDAGCFVAEV